MKFLKKMKSVLSQWLEGSAVVRCLKGAGRWFMKLCSRSFIVTSFADEGVSGSVMGSASSKGICGIFSFFEKMGEKWGRNAAQNSSIVALVDRIVKAMWSMPVKVYGAAFICIGIVYGGFSYLRLGHISVAMVVGTLIVGCIMCFPRTSLKGLLSSSVIGKLIGLHEEDDKYDNPTSLNYGIAIAVSALWSLTAVYVTPTYAFLGVAGLAFLVAILYMPEVGIYFAVALAPFIPTMALAGLMAVTAVCFVFKLIFSTGYKFYTDATGVFVAVFALLLIIAGITSYSLASSIKIALLEVLFLFSYFLIMTLFRQRKKIMLLLFIYVTSALFTGFVGIYQNISGMVDQTWVDSELFNGLWLRVYSTFENPNVYGEYLLLTVFVSAALALISKKLIGKIYYSGVTVVLLINLALTYSRGCYLAVLFGMFVFICFCARKLLILAAAGVIASPLVLPSSIIQRFTSITNLSDSSTSYRINIWRGTLDMLKDFWALGTGLGSEAYNKIYPRYALAAVTAPHAHCLFLQIAAEMGIGGLLIFLCVVFCFFNENVTAFLRMKDWRNKVLTAAFISAGGAFLFESIFEYTWYNYRVFLIFFMFLAMANAVAQLAKEDVDG